MSENRFDDDHVGENPVSWPNYRIDNHPDLWGADEIVESIEQCRGCSHREGVCQHHRGMMEGYDKAVQDMNRAFDITKEDYPDELLEAENAE